MKKNSLCLFLMGCIFLLSTSSAEAIPKEVYAEWETRYMNTVDTQLTVKVIEDDGAILCGLRSKIWLPCFCSVIYEVIKIEKKPKTIDLKEGDQLRLKYRCDRKKRYVGGDSTLPWLSEGSEKESMELRFRSSYLEHKKANKWVVKNGEKVFYPYLHDREL